MFGSEPARRRLVLVLVQRSRLRKRHEARPLYLGGERAWGPRTRRDARQPQPADQPRIDSL